MKAVAMKPVLIPFALTALCLATAASASTPIDQTRPLDANASVWLDNVKGRIHVEVWDRAEIHIGGFLGEGVKELSVDGSASSLRVKVVYPDSRGWFGGGNNGEESDLLVKLPAGVELSVDAVSAEVGVRGVNGRALNIDSVSGDVDVVTGAGKVEVDVVSGDVKVEAQSDEVSIESVSGDIELRGAIRRSVSVESVSGDLSVETGERLRSVSAGVVSGDIEIRTGLGADATVNAESLSGDLELVLPANTSARLKASSFTGTLTSDAGRVVKPEHGPGSNLDTVLGDGDGNIVLETFSGDLTIRLQ